MQTTDKIQMGTPVKGHTKMTKKRKTTDAVKILHKRYIKDSEAKKMLQKAREQSDIASQIYALRHQAGLSQAELAKIVGTTQSVISQLEDADYKGHSLEMLRRIAQALHCTIQVQIKPEKGYAAYA